MTNSPLPYFTKYLRQCPIDERDAEYYETNKELARDIGVKVMYENKYNFWNLVDKAPKQLWGRKDDMGISLDILWAEEQIDIAYEMA